jgi:hypothetical protein
MCRRVTCAQCGKPTFAGCGRHVEQVLGDVPAAQRCQCRESRAAPLGTQRSAPIGLINNIKDWFT